MGRRAVTRKRTTRGIYGRKKKRIGIINGIKRKWLVVHFNGYAIVRTIFHQFFFLSFL